MYMYINVYSTLPKEVQNPPSPPPPPMYIICRMLNTDDCYLYTLLLSYMYITRRTPLATFMDFKSDILDMDLDEDRWLWVTVGSDKIVKVCVCVCV